MEEDDLYRGYMESLIQRLLLKTYPDGKIPIEEEVKVLIKNQMIKKYPEFDHDVRFEKHYSMCYDYAFIVITLEESGNLPCILM